MACYRGERQTASRLRTAHCPSILQYSENNKLSSGAVKYPRQFFGFPQFFLRRRRRKKRPLTALKSTVGSLLCLLSNVIGSGHGRSGFFLGMVRKITTGYRYSD